MARRSAWFDDIVVLPYATILNRPRGAAGMSGGPLFPDFDSRTWERHHRYGTAADSEPLLLADVTADLAGSWVWCGPAVDDFSHQLAEFSHRYPLEDPAGISGLLFSTTPGAGEEPLTELPGFVRQLLEYLALDHIPTHLVTAPTRVDRLLVISQGAQLGVAPDKEYRDALLARQPQPSPTGGKGHYVYLSRAGLDRGRLLGEHYVERLLAESGFTVVRPEEVPLSGVYDVVLSASHVLLSEGGIVHGLELLGRIPGNVSMIARRTRGAPSRQHLMTSLGARTAGCFTVIDAAVGFVSLGDPAQWDTDPNGMALVDPGELTAALASLGFLEIAARFDVVEFARVAHADLDTYRSSYYASLMAADPAFVERWLLVQSAVVAWIASFT